MWTRTTVSLFLTFFIFSCAGVALDRTSRPGEFDEGYAVFYSDHFDGHKTASGELYDKTKLTGAHRTLPFGTIVRVINLQNRRTVEIRINDRGPFNKRKRIIDLSRAAASRLDMIKAGIVPVRVEIVALADKNPHARK